MVVSPCTSNHFSMHLHIPKIALGLCFSLMNFKIRWKVFSSTDFEIHWSFRKILQRILKSIEGIFKGFNRFVNLLKKKTFKEFWNLLKKKFYNEFQNLWRLGKSVNEFRNPFNKKSFNEFWNLLKHIQWGVRFFEL